MVSREVALGLVTSGLLLLVLNSREREELSAGRVCVSHSRAYYQGGEKKKKKKQHLRCSAHAMRNCVDYHEKRSCVRIECFKKCNSRQGS